MKIFILSFTLFISAYLWATSFSFKGDPFGAVTRVENNPQCDDNNNSNSGNHFSECVKKLSDFCNTFTDFSNNQCFEKSVNACDDGVKANCVKDMALYCEYNTEFSNNQCWEKSINACNGRADAMREISEAAKNKTMRAVQKLTVE
jgi:hypothetical protein